jgi:hypothetical protein
MPLDPMLAENEVSKGCANSDRHVTVTMTKEASRTAAKCHSLRLARRHMSAEEDPYMKYHAYDVFGIERDVNRPDISCFFD